MPKRSLHRFPEEQRLEIAEAFYRGGSVQRVYDGFYERYGTEQFHHYNYDSFASYRRSTTYQEDIQPFLDDIRTSPGKRQYTQRPERIEALAEMLGMVLTALRDKEYEGKKLTVGSLSELIKSAAKLLTDLRTESEPFDSALAKGAKSPFEIAQEEMQSLEEEISKRIERGVERRLAELQHAVGPTN